jgi:hypothetical protein
MKLTVHMTGMSPLLMHNPRLADPDDEIVQEIHKINSKQKKTADDREHRSHLEFIGGLYLGVNGPVIPAVNIRKCWIETGRSRKLGTAVQRAVIMNAVEYPVEYDGPRDPEELWQETSHRNRMMIATGNGRSRARLPRIRPMFMPWGLTFEIDLITQFIDLDAFQEIVRDAGIIEGLGDGRIIGFGRHETIIK